VTQYHDAVAGISPVAALWYNGVLKEKEET
jgi:hypothetical protein